MAAQQAAVVQSEGEGDHHTEKFVCGAANVCIVLVPWEPEDPGPVSIPVWVFGPSRQGVNIRP